MIKKFLLAAMLIWCAAEGMAQERNLVQERFYCDSYFMYNLYSDYTAELVDLNGGCSESLVIPSSIVDSEDDDKKEYKVVKVADNVFSYVDMVAKVYIEAETLILGKNPFNGKTPNNGTPSLFVLPCFDASNWKNDFDVYTYLPGLDDAVIPEKPLEITYEGNIPIDLGTTPYKIETEKYTLSITKLQPLDEYNGSISAIDYTILNTSTSQPVCAINGSNNLEIEKNILKVLPKDNFEIKPENISFVNDVKYYPTENNDIIVTKEAFIKRYDFNIFSNDKCYFLGEGNTDTIIVECSIAPTAVDGTPSLQITISENAEPSLCGTTASHYNKVSFPKNFTVPLVGDKVKVYITDNDNIQTKSERYCEYYDSENKIQNAYTWEKYTLMAQDPNLFGSATPTQAAVYTLPSLPEILTKSYDNSASYTVENMPTNIYLHIAYSLNIENISKKHYSDGRDIGNNHILLSEFAKVAQHRTITIPVEAKLVFLDKDNKEDASVGKDKKVKLILTPTDQSSYPEFYEALIDNEIILDGYSGTITPMQLSEKDIADIETLIKDALEPTKIEDGESDINFNPTKLTYETEKYNVTINEAKYLKSGKEVSTPGSDYDMKVTYEVDHNFCFGSTQTGYEYQKSVIFEKDGEILADCSPNNSQVAEIINIIEATALQGEYTGSSAREWTTELPSTSSGLNFVITNVTTIDGSTHKPVSDVTFDKSQNPAYVGMCINYQIEKDNEVCFDASNSNYSDIYVLPDPTSSAPKGFKITPTKLDISIKPEDLDGKVSLTRKYNSEDASADILQSTVTKNDHTFEITSAIFTDNTPGTNKQIAITIKLKDNNPNYTFDPTTVTITGGTIEEESQNNNKNIVIKSESIQQNPNHQQAYCIEGVNGLELKFQRVAGDIKSFKIKVDGDEKLSEIMSTDGKIKGDTLIYVNIPSNTMPGKYSGTIQFFGEEGKYESEQYKFDFIVDMPPSMVKYLYHNVIFVDNHDNLFTEYQWYKNGEKIEGATRQYYYEKTLDGEYYVACKHNSGISLHSCPVKGEVSTKVSVSSVKVYPNPAQANIPFNLELVGGNGNYSGAEMMIYNNSGNLVKHITNITDIITLTLPQGNYSGALFFNGEKTGFKIIVK